MTQIVLAKVQCCRVWPIVYATAEGVYRWHRCGLCGQKPELISGSFELLGEDDDV